MFNCSSSGSYTLCWLQGTLHECHMQSISGLTERRQLSAAAELQERCVIGTKSGFHLWISTGDYNSNVSRTLQVFWAEQGWGSFNVGRNEN